MTATLPALILVVDDNPATLYTTSRVLRSAGFDVREASTGAAGLAEAQAVDLVVLDVNLPDYSGFEVCRRLRADPRTVRTPVIHLSATFVKDVDKVLGYEVGADGYLTHPVEPPVLVATVQAFLRARRAEEETRRSEAKFRSIVDNAPSGISLLDQDLRHLEANAAMAAILGRSPSELIGSPLSDVFSDDDHCRMRDALATHGRWRGNRRLRDADGREIRVDWNVSKHSLAGVYLAIATDVSYLAQLEEQRTHLLASERGARAEAERANRQKDEFLATVSHDLRTPLAAVINWAQALQQPAIAAERRTEGLQAIERNAGIAVRLIADLLDVSRIESGKMRFSVQSVDAVQLVTAALEASRSAAEHKGVTVRQKGTPPARWIHGDPTRLHQVVWNLVSNAIKFTPPGGQVEVELRGTDHELEIVVRDDGKGIPAELLPHVFDRFRQGGSATARQDGLGLGLSIVLHVVETHGGRVHAESAGEGKGATFVVTLPASREPEAAADDAGTPSGRETLAGARILVVDDDADARHFTERLLLEHGADVRTASSVVTALPMLDSFAPRLLISDLGMPERDGYDLLRTVRTRGWTAARLPAIALTAYTSAAERLRTNAAGFQVHIGKPVVASFLVASAARLINTAASQCPHHVEGTAEA